MIKLLPGIIAKPISFIAMTILLVACGEAQISVEADTVSASNSTAAQTVRSVQVENTRWYTVAQSSAGEQIFTNNCAVCHGGRAQGITDDWREKMAGGRFPPPPLNGSAHAWHHPRSVLLQVINNGGAEFGGKMPPFENVLNEEQKLQAIAFFQSLWTDEIYEQWEDIDGSN